MSDSKIEWTDWTWNPVTGCTKVSQGCKHCYAERLWPKVEGARVKREGGEPRPFTHVSIHPERLDQPLRMRRPRRIFVNSMSDLFHEDVPEEFIRDVLNVIATCLVQRPGHVFQVLTKRPKRMLALMRNAAGSNALGIKWGPMPNLWLGVSVEDQPTADERIPLLLQTPAAVHWISVEPLLGPVNLMGICSVPACFNALIPGRYPRLDWVVAGGESGPDARPSHPGWFRALRDQCAYAGVPFLFKQWGAWVPGETEVITEPPWKAAYPDDEAIQLVDGRGYTCIEAHGREFIRVGKKAAGRALDGRIHDEYPA